jgi:hypothetical protein
MKGTDIKLKDPLSPWAPEMSMRRVKEETHALGIMYLMRGK